MAGKNRFPFVECVMLEINPGRFTVCTNSADKNCEKKRETSEKLEFSGESKKKIIKQERYHLNHIEVDHTYFIFDCFVGPIPSANVLLIETKVNQF